jgi:hypothetical protein
MQDTLDQLNAQIRATKKQLEILEEARAHLEEAVEDARRVAQGVRRTGGFAPVVLTNEELRAAIERLIMEEPRSLDELCDILAPDRDPDEYLRVRAALQWVKRNRHVVNLGTPKRGVWSIPPKKKTKKKTNGSGK